MRPLLQSIMTRALALLASLLVFAITKLIMEIGADLFTGTLWHTAMEHNWLQSKVNWPLVPGGDEMGGIVSWAYPVCAGLVAMIAFWRGWPSTWVRILVYLLAIELLAPMSWINYALSDQWLNIWVQAGFNLVMAIFFLTIVYGLRAIKSDAPDMLALQSVSILILTSFGVYLPIFYTSIFLAYAAGAITHNQVSGISSHAPLLFAGGAGAVTTFLAQLDKLRK